MGNLISMLYDFPIFCLLVKYFSSSVVFGVRLHIDVLGTCVMIVCKMLAMHRSDIKNGCKQFPIVEHN